MKKFASIFSVVMCLFLFAGVLVCSADSYYSLDDRSDLIKYTSSTRYYLDVAYQGTVSRFGYGESATFVCYGDELFIYGCPSLTAVRAAVFVDGFVVGYTRDIGNPSTLSAPELVFSKIDLGPGEHVVSIVGFQRYVSGTTAGHFYLDRVECAKSFSTVDLLPTMLMAAVFFLVLIMLVYFAFKLVFWRLHKDE